MDNKNVFVAIALSMSVLLFWGAFFDTPPPAVTNKDQTTINPENKNIDFSFGNFCHSNFRLF